MTMTPRRMALWALWGLALLALAGFGWLKLSPMLDRNGAVVIGPGDYHLETTEGAPFTEDTLEGSHSAVFFGFTHCPEVCPTTLGDITTWQEELGPEDELRVFFVTVDPERDTAEVLHDYVSWAPGVTGVTGSPEEVAKALSAFRVYARKVPLGAGRYTMDHSANILLFDADGRFFEPIGYQEDPDRVMEKIRRMLAG